MDEPDSGETIRAQMSVSWAATPALYDVDDLAAKRAVRSAGERRFGLG